MVYVCERKNYANNGNMHRDSVHTVYNVDWMEHSKILLIKCCYEMIFVVIFFFLLTSTSV